MKKKLVIAGSASLQEKIKYWKSLWENNGFEVIDYPDAISAKTFIEDYPKVHKDFFRNIEKADIIFIMNENKNGITGYIGAETFAEMGYAVTQNLIHDKKLEVILLQMPEKSVASYDEIVLWLNLGWIKLLDKSNTQNIS